MRKITILLGALLCLASCKKESCDKSVFIPSGFALNDCNEKPCLETSTVEVEGKTVCACRTGWAEFGLKADDPQTSEEWQTKMRLSAAQTEDDSIRIAAKALQLAFPVHVDCSTF